MTTIKTIAVFTALFASAAFAQVTVKFTPESSAVPTAVVSNVRGLIRYQADFCNATTGPAAVLTPQLLSLAAPTIPFLDSNDAVLALNGAIKKTFWSQVERYSGLAAQGVGLALAIKGGNAGLATGLSIGGSLLPGVVAIAQGQVPSAAPLLVTLSYPLTLAPGACNTDHLFASKPAKGKGAPTPVIAVIASH